MMALAGMTRHPLRTDEEVDREVFGAPRNDAHYDDGSATVMATEPVMLLQGSTLTRSGNFEHTAKGNRMPSGHRGMGVPTAAASGYSSRFSLRFPQ